MSKITAVCDQKRGVGKILTVVSLGVGLARMGSGSLWLTLMLKGL